MSIRFKLAILFFLLAVIPSFCVGILTFNNYRNSLVSNRISELKNLSAFRADKIEAYFAKLKSDIGLVQGSYVVKKGFPILNRFAYKADGQEFVDAKQMLDSSVLKMTKVFGLLDLMLLNPQGKVVYSSNPEHFPKNFLKPLGDPGEKVFEEGKKGTYLSDIFLNKINNNQPGMFLSAPAFDFNGSFMGVIVFELDLVPMHTFIQDASGLGKTGEVLIGKREGKEVVFLSHLRHDPDSLLKKKVLLGAGVGQPIQKAAQGSSGAGELIDYRGKKVIAAWHFVPSLGWGMVAKIDSSEAFAEVHKLWLLGVLILILGSIFSCAAAFFIAHSITGPIKKLAKGAEIVGNGNLDYRVGLNINDEIGQLSRAFDKMTQDLKSVTASHDELNREIFERKQAEEALAKQEEELRTILDAVPASIFYKDKENRFLRVNKAFCEIMGMKKEELEHKSIFDIYPKEQAEAFWRDDLEVIQSGKPKIGIIESVRSNKGELLAQTDKIPYRDAQGNIIGIIGFAVDITERKRTELALRYNQEDLNRAQAVAHTGSWRLDVNKNELTWSDENHRMFGIPKGTAMTYETFLGAIHPDDRRDVDEKWIAALRGEPYDIEHRIIVEGKIKWVRERATLEFDAEGKLLGGFGTTQDITELKATEEELRKAYDALEERVRERTAELASERQRLYDVFETLPVYIVLLTPDYRVSFANRFFRERFGEDHGRCCFDYLFKRSSPCENCETYKVLKTHGPHHWEWLGPDGRNYDVHDFPFKEKDGSIHVMEMGIDITERKRAQAELIKAMDILAEAKRLSDIGTLAATVAHELRNPLAAIKMAAYNIKRKSQNSGLDSHLKNIEIKVNESEQIISNLLFYSKIKMPRLENINIHNILLACIRETQEHFAKKHACVDKDLNSIKDTLVKADALQMKEVFSNILNNAFDALPDKDARVYVRSEISRESVKISISDNGEGIDAEVLKRVFEPFFTTKAKGTGLGLSLCHQIMNLHNGSIDIESKKGSWTAVTLTLPITHKEDAKKDPVSG